MLQIHIARHGQSLGSFNIEEVEQGISSGNFSKEHDLAWMPGMTEWEPLSEVMLAVSDSGSLLASSTEVASGTLIEPAWERRSEIGFFKALFQTIFGVLFSPRKTFSKMKTTGGLGGPLFFWGITHVVLVFLTSPNQVQCVKDFVAAVPWFAAHANNPKVFKILHSGATDISLQKVMFIGLQMVLGLFMAAVLLHVSLKISKSAQRPFEATLRVFCYCGAYALVGTFFCLINLGVGKWELIPVNGRIILYLIEMLLGLVVSGTILFMGIKKVHHLSSWRVLFVSMLAIFLVPLLTAGIAVLIGVLLLLGAIVLAFVKHRIH